MRFVSHTIKQHTPMGVIPMPDYEVLSKRFSDRIQMIKLMDKLRAKPIKFDYRLN